MQDLSMSLTKKSLLSLQANLEHEILDDELFSWSQSQIIYAFFAHARRHNAKRIEALSRWLKGDNSQYAAHLLVSPCDVLSFGLWMLHHKVKPRRVYSSKPFISNRMLLRTESLFNKLANYVWIWDMLRMSINGDAICDFDGGTEYSFKLVESVDQQYLAAEHFFVGPPAGGANELLAAVLECAADSRTQKQQNQSSLPNFHRRSFNRLVKVIEDDQSQLNLLPPNVMIRSYCLGDYYHLWACLTGLTLVHARQSRRADDKSFLRFDIDTWMRWLERHSGLSSRQLSSLILDFTYRPQDLMYPDSGFCTFFIQDGPMLCLYPDMLFQTSADEVFYRQMEKVHLTKFKQLKDDKESYQLDRIFKWSSKTNLKTFGPFRNVAVQGRRPTDLDLLLLDYEAKEGLCCQLKFNAYPRWRNFMPEVAKDLQHGIGQCITSIQWLESAPQAVLTKSNLSAKELREFRFYGVVVSARTLGSGLVKRIPDVLVVTEKMFEQMFSFEARYRVKTSDRWALMKSGRNLPIEGIDFKTADIDLEFHDKHFRMLNSYAVPRRH
jgi:hypothetical protein